MEVKGKMRRMRKIVKNKKAPNLGTGEFERSLLHGWGGENSNAYNKKERIKSLQGLRAFAFLGVIFGHTDLAESTFHYVGYMAVSLFFILSGFVSVYSQIDKTNFYPSISYNFKYLVNRLKKLYPLYVLCTLAMVVFCFVGEDTESIGNFIIRLVLNFTLLQEWLPLRYRSIAGTAWFLCPLALFYFVFPYVLKRFQKNYTEKKAKKTIIILITIEALIAIASLYLPRPVYSEDMLLEYKLSYWFCYNFPLSRLVDCLIGCNLGYLFICNKDERINFATLKETVALALCLITSVIGSVVSLITPLNAKIPSVDYTIGWSKALLYLPGTMSIIYIFAFEQGKVSKFFENKFFMYLAKLSPYGFLIHHVIFYYFNTTVYHVMGKDAYNIFNKQYGGWIKLIIGLFLTLVVCQIWIWFMNLLSKKKQLDR